MKVTAEQLIKQIATEIILGIAPEYKQRNMTARAVEIADDKAEGTATEEDIAESNLIRQTWAHITAIRDKSNELEAVYNGEISRHEQKEISDSLRSLA